MIGLVAIPAAESLRGLKVSHEGADGSWREGREHGRNRPELKASRREQKGAGGGARRQVVDSGRAKRRGKSQRTGFGKGLDEGVNIDI